MYLLDQALELNLVGRTSVNLIIKMIDQDEVHKVIIDTKSMDIADIKQMLKKLYNEAKITVNKEVKSNKRNEKKEKT